MEKVADFSSLSIVLVKSFKYQMKRELLTFESVLFGPLESVKCWVLCIFFMEFRMCAKFNSSADV